MVRHRVVPGRRHNALLCFNDGKIPCKRTHVRRREGKRFLMNDNSTHGT